MELYEHVFYTFAQAEKNNVDLSVGRSIHCNSQPMSATERASLANKIATVTSPRHHYSALCGIWYQYQKHFIDKATCLAEFKKLTQEVYHYG